MRPSALPRRCAFVSTSLLALGALVLTGCTGNNASGGTHSGSVATADKSATLTIWTDPTRLPGFQQFKKSHSDVKMNIVTVDQTQLLSKIQLDNTANKNWPDVMFISGPQKITNLVSDQYKNFAAPLDAMLPDNVKKGFGTALSGCTINGKIYCLKNDIAPTVIYYDKTTLDKFGYSVPKTMQQYIDLGVKLGKEHPGYLMADGFSAFLIDEYYTPSGCPKPSGQRQRHQADPQLEGSQVCAGYQCD